MLLCMALLLLPGALWGADARARKRVRISSSAIDRLMELDEDGNPVSG